MMIGFLDGLKRERDISIKAMSSGRKMAFRYNSPLSAYTLWEVFTFYLQLVMLAYGWII